MLAGFNRRDDGMLRRVEVLGCVSVLRVIATADVSTGPAESQMDPGIAQLKALLAAATTWVAGPDKV